MRNRGDTRDLKFLIKIFDFQKRQCQLGLRSLRFQVFNALFVPKTFQLPILYNSTFQGL